MFSDRSTVKHKVPKSLIFIENLSNNQYNMDTAEHS